MPRTAVIHTDGAARGNPGPAGIGVVARTKQGAVLFEHAEYIGEATNNVAEYTAFIQGLRMARDKGIDTVRMASDSELLVRQLHGLYKVRHPNLKGLYDQAVALMGQFEHVEVYHVPREKNAEADALANRAIKAHNGARKN